MKLQQFLCWDENREQDDGETFECFDPEAAAEEAAERFDDDASEGASSNQEIFVKGPDGSTEKFAVSVEFIPHYSALQIED